MSAGNAWGSSKWDGLGAAVCVRHPQSSATGTCLRCGDFICPTCTRTGREGEILCVSCAERNAPPAEPLEWERREELGFASAFWQTLKGSLTSPHTFFRKVDPFGSYRDAIYYAVLCLGMSLVGTLLSTGAQFGSSLLWQDSPWGGGQVFNDVPLWGVGLGVVGAVVLLPPLMLLGTFINAGLLHLACMVVGADSGGYKATYRLLAYSQGTNAVVGMVQVVVALLGVWHPIAYTVVSLFGSLAAMVFGLYTLVLQVFGIRDVHQVTTGRAFGAVAVLFGVGLLLVCGCYALMIFAVIGAVGSSGFF